MKVTQLQADLPALRWCDYRRIVFFTGAGLSAESGVPTYRGAGGIWGKYDWQSYACQDAFEADPKKVLDFHEMRRAAVLGCKPNSAHYAIAQFQKLNPAVSIITQNIDGLHQRAGTTEILELHGSLWRVRCNCHGARTDIGERFERHRCIDCGCWVRPDITWFGDVLNEKILARAHSLTASSDLFVVIGTSGQVWPAAGFPQLAKEAGSRTICINIEPPENSHVYSDILIGSASHVLAALLPIGALPNITE